MKSVFTTILFLIAVYHGLSWIKDDGHVPSPSHLIDDRESSQEDGKVDPSAHLRRRSNFRTSMEWIGLFSLFSALIANNFKPPKPVRVSGGLLQGKISSDGSYTAYYGVPYATVERRFQDAVPNPVWYGVKKADNPYIRCTQKASISFLVLGQEDCLILNVYVPKNTSKKLRSVMVFMHGGGFISGSGAPILYGPEYFMKHDVILVTINYRLDILGYLCLGIKEAPGNVGLKDQVLALKWVQKNIKSFGGDPKSVTIFGESAGASSVSYHILSPMSKGLFTKAIMQSGTALSPWAFQYDPVGIARQFAQQLGKDTEDLHQLVKIFREKSAKELLRHSIPKPVGTTAFANFVFVPCLEKKIKGVDRFLPDYPYKIMSTGNYNKVPVLMGHNNAEGLFFVGMEADINSLDFLNSMPRDLKFPSLEKKHEVGMELRDLYLHGRNVSKQTLQEYSMYVADSQLVYSIERSIEKFLQTMDKPLYAYKFSYDGYLNLAKFIVGLKKYPGATHVDELLYMFKSVAPINGTPSDQDMINKVTTKWTNFAKYGDPTPYESLSLPVQWEAASEEDPKLFVINKKMSYTKLFESYCLRFWKTLYSKYFILKRYL